MCGPILIVPVYPKNFILENGEKALIKRLKTIRKNSEEWREAKNLLKLPVIHTHEQCSMVLPGNGVRLFFVDDGKGMFFVLDGTCVINNHAVSDKTQIILSSSKLGQELIGKKINDSGIFNDGIKKRIFIVKNIERPSKAKWLFHY